MDNERSGIDAGIATEENAQKKGKHYLFGIGIREYSNMHDLPNADKDCEEVLKSLTSNYKGFDTCKESDGSLVSLLNTKATSKAIKEQLKKYLELQSEDKLLIYFAGHGHKDSKGIGYWICADSNRVYSTDSSKLSTNDLVKNYFNKYKCKLLLIIDACFSASIIDDSNDTIRATVQENWDCKFVICSGQHDELVSDGTKGKNSPFAKALLQVLEEPQVKKYNQMILFDRINKIFQRDSKKKREQTPHWGYLNKVKGSFIMKYKYPQLANVNKATEYGQGEIVQVETTKSHWSLGIAAFFLLIVFGLFWEFFKPNKENQGGTTSNPETIDTSKTQSIIEPKPEQIKPTDNTPTKREQYIPPKDNTNVDFDFAMDRIRVGGEYFEFGQTIENISYKFNAGKRIYEIKHPSPFILLLTSFEKKNHLNTCNIYFRIHFNCSEPTEINDKRRKIFKDIMLDRRFSQIHIMLAEDSIISDIGETIEVFIKKRF